MSRPPPPAGHRSWLDYAVATMDSRAAALEYILSDDADKWSRDEMEQAVREELAELRRQAGQEAV